MKKFMNLLKKLVTVWLAVLFMLGSLEGTAWAKASFSSIDAIKPILESSLDRSSQIPPSGKDNLESNDLEKSVHIGQGDESDQAVHAFPEKPSYLLNDKDGSGQGRSLQSFQALNSGPYTMAYLNTLEHSELVGLLRTISSKDIPELFIYNNETYAFYKDQERVQALIDALKESGEQYTENNSMGIPTLVEVLRSGFYLGYYNQPLKYLMNKDFLVRMFPALLAIENNSRFGLGTTTQNQVVQSLGSMIGNVSVNAEIIRKSTNILTQFNQNFDEFSQNTSKGNAVYGLLKGIGYVLMWGLDQTDKAAIRGQIDGFLNELAITAQYNQFNDGNAWVINNGLYYIGHLGSYHTDPYKGNQALTEALIKFENLGYQYILSAQLIDEIYKGKDYYGNNINYKTVIVKQAEQKYLPNRYTFDDGTMIMRTGGNVTEEKIKRLFWASKEVKAQFHRVFGSDDPVGLNRVDEILTMVIYNNPTEYKINSLLYGLSTDNGGLYMEGMGTFFTYERTPAQSIYTLEELFRHEFTHYLQGRFLVPGLWGQNQIYEGSRMPWFEEGGAELFAGSTRTNDILARKSMVSNLIRDGQSAWMTASDTLYSAYGSFKFYTYAYALQYHMYTNNPVMLDTLAYHISRSEANGVAGYDTYRRELSQNNQLNTDYNQTMQAMVRDYNNNQLTIPLVSDDYLAAHESKYYTEIFDDIAQGANLQNVKTEIHQSQFFKTFILKGTYTGGAPNSKLNDRKALNDKINEFLIGLNDNQWSGYKTLTSYFTNYRVVNSNYVFDVVVHGLLPNEPSEGNAPPVVAINGPYEGVAGRAIQFSSVGSYAPSGLIVTYEWDFGDGTTGTGAAPTHAYTAAGSFTLKLKVTDNNGNSSEQSTTVHVQPLTKEIKPNHTIALATGPVPYDFVFPASYERSDPNDSYFYFVVDSPADVNIVVADPQGINMNWVAYHESDLNNYASWGSRQGTNLSNTIKNASGKYYLRVYRSNASSQNGDYTIKLSKSGSVKPVVDHILISGSDSVNIPKTGSVAANYAAKVFDKENKEMTGEGVTWSLKAPVTGVSVNADGIVTVNSTARSGTFTLVAKSVTNSQIFAEKQVNLTGIITQEIKPNHTVALATGPLTTNIPVSATIEDQYTSAYFYFEVNSQTDVDIVVANPNGLNINWLLFHESDLGARITWGAKNGSNIIGSVKNAFGKYYLQVYKSTPTNNGDYTVTVSWDEAEQPVVTSIAISGANLMDVPATGSVTSDYTARVFDQAGNELAEEGVAWSLKESVTGVSVNASNGTVTVDNTAGAGEFALVAASISNSSVTAEKKVVLSKVTVPSVTSIAISGTDKVNIPKAGSVTLNYTAKVFDEEGNEMAGEGVVWSLKEQVIGVSVNDTTGMVTVDSAASAGEFTLIAASATDPNVFKEKHVSLVGTITEEIKPNHTVALATGPLTPNVPVSATIEDQYSQAYFYFEVESPADVDIIVANPEGLNITWLLFHESDLVNRVAYGINNGSNLVGSVNNALGKYYLQVYKYEPYNNGSYSVAVSWDEMEIPVVTSIAISGANVIDIPAAGSVTANYTARVLDEEGNEMVGESVVWRLKAPVTGVSVNASNGTVTVDNTAGVGEFALIAASITDSSITAEKKVVLSKVAVPAVTSISISGMNVIDIPATGSITSNYTAKVFDEEGNEMVGEGVVWSLKAPMTGVSVNALNGTVTVDSTANAGNFTLIIASVANSGVKAEKTIMLKTVKSGDGGNNSDPEPWTWPNTGTNSPTKTEVKNGTSDKPTNQPSNNQHDNGKTFDDIHNHWAREDIEFLASKGLISGIANGIFAPDATVTRAEFATLLVRTLGLKLNESASQFTDVKSGDWHHGYVATAAKAGLIQGFEDSTFRPNDPITREQIAVMIAKAIEYTGKGNNLKASAEQLLANFGDRDQVSVWAQHAIEQAVDLGIIQGVDYNKLAPSDHATRAQAVVMIRRLLKYL